MSGPDRLNRWVPRLTVFVATAHAAVGVALYGGVYRRMLGEGLVGSNTGGRLEREAATWFMVAAPALAGLGLAAREGVARTGAIPAAVPLTQLGLGALITTVSPRSGGWSLLGLGAAGLLARCQAESRRSTT